jgi:hypothetical protein
VLARQPKKSRTRLFACSTTSATCRCQAGFGVHAGLEPLEAITAGTGGGGDGREGDRGQHHGRGEEHRGDRARELDSLSFIDIIDER